MDPASPSASATRKPTRRPFRAHRIRSVRDPRFPAAWTIYQRSFPAAERRDRRAQKKLLAEPRYSMVGVMQGGRVIGILCTWDLGGFRFVEHFAVREDLRGMGIGSGILARALPAVCPVVLEVEPPDTAESARRIGFYRRLGFHLSRSAYVQPPYSAAGTPVRMRLMSRPGRLLGREFERVRAILHSTVYGLSAPLRGSPSVGRDPDRHGFQRRRS